MTGDISIVVSADIGEYGPMDGKAVNFHFPVYAHLQGTLPILFLAALFGLKENRYRSAIWIAAVYVFLWGVFIFVKWFFGFPISADVEMNLMFSGLVGSFTALLLLGGRMTGRKRIGLLVVPFVYIGVIFLSGIITQETLDMAVFLVLSMLSLYGAFIGAKIACRKACSIRGFLLWKGISLVVSLMIIFLIAAYLLNLQGHLPLKQLIVEVLGCVTVCSVIYYIGALPFEILMFVNPFWQKRFEAVFGLTLKFHFETVDIRF